MPTPRTSRAAAACTLALALAAVAGPATAAGKSDAITLVGLTEDGTSLVTFSSAKPQQAWR